ncbi:hypothetical protein D5086_007158 [Populus alba]|uniref:Uncharacterized protein n=1 Tax=Populus alba TaxID=43335 RepID=A0ACC4CML9_POPAL
MCRMRTFLIEGFFCHTHNAAWHTLHNIICGTGSRLDGYNVQQKVPRAKVKVIDGEDHITIVVNRQKVFARELEEIWRGGDRVVN